MSLPNFASRPRARRAWASAFNLFSPFSYDMLGTHNRMSCFGFCQAAGECGPGQTLGDGCYWRVLNMTSNVNSTCVNDNLVTTAVAYNQSCWSGCTGQLRHYF